MKGQNKLQLPTTQRLRNLPQLDPSDMGNVPTCRPVGPIEGKSHRTVNRFDAFGLVTHSQGGWDTPRLIEPVRYRDASLRRTTHTAFSGPTRLVSRWTPAGGSRNEVPDDDSHSLIQIPRVQFERIRQQVIFKQDQGQGLGRSSQSFLSDNSIFSNRFSKFRLVAQRARCRRCATGYAPANTSKRSEKSSAGSPTSGIQVLTTSGSTYGTRHGESAGDSATVFRWHTKLYHEHAVTMTIGSAAANRWWLVRNGGPRWITELARGQVAADGFVDTKIPR